MDKGKNGYKRRCLYALFVVFWVLFFGAYGFLNRLNLAPMETVKNNKEPEKFQKENDDNGRANTAARAKEEVGGQDEDWQSGKKPVSASLHAPKPVPPPSVAAFKEWVECYRLANDDDRAGLVAEGEKLAQERKALFKRIIQARPELAGDFALTAEEQAELPDEIAALVETEVKGTASVKVSCVLMPPGKPGSRMVNSVQIGNVSYEGFYKGIEVPDGADLEGVALDGQLAVTKASVRDGYRPISPYAANLTGNTTMLYIITRFSDEGSEPLSQGQAESNMAKLDSFFRDNSGNVCSFTTTYVSVQLGYTKATANSSKTFDSAGTSLLEDARNAAISAGQNYSNFDLYIVATSELTGAAFGYAGRAYLYTGKGCHLNGSFDLDTAGHEIGHNFGLRHANYWLTNHATHPFGSDTNPGGYAPDSGNKEWIEYGHYVDLMGSQNIDESNDGTAHFSAWKKRYVGWLTAGQHPAVSSNGTQRIYRHDHRDASGATRGVQIDVATSDPSGAGRRYVLEYRYALKLLNNFRNGLVVYAAKPTYDSDGVVLLDMTPQSNDGPRYSSFLPYDDNNDKMDAPLPLGKTFSDVAAATPIHITPVALGGSSPNEYIDVTINIGSFGGNQNPTTNISATKTTGIKPMESVTFTATNVNDNDGDSPLAYSFDFEDGLSSNNSTSASHFWRKPGTYTVTVTVSDMKGGKGTASVQVTVDNTAPANDDLANALDLGSGCGRYIATNVNATKETGEPNHAGDTTPSGRSVWFAWTAPSNGQLTVATTGSTFVYQSNTYQLNTLLAVYTGSGYPVTLVGENNDEPGKVTSRLTAVVSSGVTYKIAIDGSDSINFGDDIKLLIDFNTSPEVQSGPTANPNPTTLNP